MTAREEAQEVLARAVGHRRAATMLDRVAHQLSVKILDDVRQAHEAGILEPELDGTATDAARSIDPFYEET